MTSLQYAYEQFCRAAIPHGGAIPINPFNSDGLMGTVSRAVMASDGVLAKERIGFGFLKREDVNAVAFIDQENREFASMTLGCLLAVPHMLSVIFCNPKCIPSVGNPSLEIDSGLSLNSLSMKGTQWVPKEIPAPRCPKRENICLWTCMLTLQFITHHEVAHIRRGHLDLLNLSTYAELDHDRDASKLDRDMMWALETDADRGAFEVCYHSVPSGTVPWVVSGKPAGSWQLSEEDRHRVISYAAACLFWLLAGGASIDREFNTHPHSIFRIGYLQLIHSRVSGAPLLMLDGFSREMIDAFTELEFPRPTAQNAFTGIEFMNGIQRLMTLRDSKLALINDAAMQRAQRVNGSSV